MTEQLAQTYYDKSQSKSTNIEVISSELFCAARQFSNYRRPTYMDYITGHQNPLYINMQYLPYI